MQSSLQSAAGMVEVELGPVARLDRCLWGAVLLNSGFLKMWRHLSRTEPCQCVSGQSWACHGALQGQMQPLHCTAGVVQPDLGAAAGLGRWSVGVVVLPVCGDFQRRRQQQATTAHRALPLCKLPLHRGLQGNGHRSCELTNQIAQISHSSLFCFCHKLLYKVLYITHINKFSAIRHAKSLPGSSLSNNFK